MVHQLVVCPYCHGKQVVKRGKTDTGKQRYRCQNEECSHHSFLLNPAYKGRLPEIKQQIIEMSLNGSGVRDTARGHCQLNGSRPDMTTTYCGHDVFEYFILDHFTFS